MTTLECESVCVCVCVCVCGPGDKVAEACADLTFEGLIELTLLKVCQF